MLSIVWSPAAQYFKVCNPIWYVFNPDFLLVDVLETRCKYDIVSLKINPTLPFRRAQLRSLSYNLAVLFLWVNANTTLKLFECATSQIVLWLGFLANKISWFQGEKPLYSNYVTKSIFKLFVFIWVSFFPLNNYRRLLYQWYSFKKNSKKIFLLRKFQLVA